MKPATQKLWAQQDRHAGDRWRLFSAVASAVTVENALYPGSFVDVAPSFVFPNVTYVDSDKRTPAFFGDEVGIAEIVSAHSTAAANPTLTFIHADYRTPLDLPFEHFDLLISLYAGFISEHCTQYLRIGGFLLVNSSHGDVALASIDPRYQLYGVVTARDSHYRVNRSNLHSYLIPKKPTSVTKEFLRQTGRGVAYTKSPFAYLFKRVG